MTRVVVEIETSAASIPWQNVLVPGRALAYALLHRTAPQLGAQLRARSQGQGPHRMVPFGHSAPRFPDARPLRGRYATGGKGVLELGSPMPEIVDAWWKALSRWPVIDWGGTPLDVVDVHRVEPPPFASGEATMRAETPIILQTPESEWLLPRESGWAEGLISNLVKKAEALGLPPDVELRRVPWVGAQRSFSRGTGRGSAPGAPAEVELIGDPRLLRAVWSWGLGRSNSAGFGWVRTRQTRQPQTAT